MVAAPTTAVPISTGLAVALKVLPQPSFSSSSSLAFSKFRVIPNESLISLAMPGICSMVEQFIHRLCIVGHRAVAIDRDGHRPHAEEAESDQTEREHRGHDAGLGRIRIDHQRQIALRYQVGAGHQRRR